jgi:hypothetical protein
MLRSLNGKVALGTLILVGAVALTLGLSMLQVRGLEHTMGHMTSDMPLPTK